MSGSIQSYQDLTAWQKAMDFAEAVYHVTERWPREELYGLSSQVRRAAVSVPSNIAEGKGRYGAAEYLHHLSIALGSLHLVGVWGSGIGDRNATRTPNADPRAPMQSASVGQLISALMRSLRGPNANPRSPSATHG